MLTVVTLASGQMPMTTTRALSRISASRQESDSAMATARQTYAAVEAGIRTGALRRVDTTFKCDSESLDYDAHSYADSAGMIRRLDLGVGTGDHAEEWSFYYDTEGRLRFAYARRGAVVGSQQEERVYYDVQGRQVARRIRWLHGPHYQFAPLAPVWNPQAWRNAACA